MHLANLARLEELDLSKTLVTDAGIARLADLANLKTIILDADQIGDEGLISLKRLSS